MRTDRSMFWALDEEGLHTNYGTWESVLATYKNCAFKIGARPYLEQALPDKAEITTRVLLGSTECVLEANTPRYQRRVAAHIFTDNKETGGECYTRFYIKHYDIFEGRERWRLEATTEGNGWLDA